MRWSIQLASLIAGGALAADAAARPALVTATPPRTCNEVDVAALQRAQIDQIARSGRRARTPAAETQARRVCDRSCAADTVVPSPFTRESALGVDADAGAPAPKRR